MLVAATARTLFAAATRHFPFSHQTARKAVRAHPPPVPRPAARLTDAPFAVAPFSRTDRRRRWAVALDTRFVPFYGDRAAAGVTGGAAEAGTHPLHRYATAVLPHRRRRYPVGLTAVGRGTPLDALVAALLDPIAARGPTVGGVTLDAGFDGGEVLQLLHRRGHSYVFPLRRTGGGRNRRNDCFARPSGAVMTAEWLTRRGERAVSPRARVWRRAGGKAPRVYAFGGWGRGAEVRRAWRARRRYRERFGIETGSRQKNQARGRTTSTDPADRLLLDGPALVLRQVWVCLALAVATARGRRPTRWVGELPLAGVLDRLAEHLRQQYPTTRRIRLPQPPLTTPAGR